MIVLLFAAAVIGGFFYYQWAENYRRSFKVVFMDVGQGDSSLIQFESGEKILVDCGPNRAVLSALGRNTVFYDRRIDYLLVTHPDLDHYGGCLDVIKRYEVGKIFVNGDDKKGDPFYVEWKTLIMNKNVEIVNVSTTLKISGTEIVFYSPDEGLRIDKTDSNNRSIVFSFEHVGRSFLFTGDMEEMLEKQLVEKYCSDEECEFDVDILKVAHHGSETSSSEIFLEKVIPELAVISVGKNKYGHPHLRAIRHLERSGAKIERTDKTGDLIIK